MSTEYQILFLAVMDSGRLLAEYSEGKGGNVREVIVNIIYPKILKNNGERKTLKQKPYEFHYKNHDNKTYFAVTDYGFNRKIVWACLNEVDREVTRMNIAANGSNTKKILIQKMKWYNDENNSKLVELQVKMDGIKEATVENVEKLLKSADRENYREESERLREGAGTLRRGRISCLACLGW